MYAIAGAFPCVTDCNRGHEDHREKLGGGCLELSADGLLTCPSYVFCRMLSASRANRCRVRCLLPSVAKSCSAWAGRCAFISSCQLLAPKASLTAPQSWSCLKASPVVPTSWRKILLAYIYQGIYSHPIYYIRPSSLSFLAVTQIRGHKEGSSPFSALPGTFLALEGIFIARRLSALFPLVDSHRYACSPPNETLHGS